MLRAIAESQNESPSIITKWLLSKGIAEEIGEVEINYETGKTKGVGGFAEECLADTAMDETDLDNWLGDTSLVVAW